MVSSSKSVLVFRSHLLPYSNTFVYNQVTSLKNFQGFLVGTKYVHEMNLDGVASEVPTNRISRALFAAIGFAPKFYSEILKHQPNLIHAHFGTDSMHAIKIKKKLNLPLITTFHGYDICVRTPEHYTHRLMWKNFERMVDQNDKIIAVSDFIVEKLVNNGVPLEKIVKHNIGIDLSNFDESSEKEDIVLFVGRLVEKKGCQYLIDAFNKFTKNFPSYKLVILGDGPLRESLKLRAAELNEKVSFLGSLPHTEVIKWMKKSKIFCAPSIIADNGDAEALGLVFAEAQAAKTPVVSFNTGGISEVVLHEKTGFLASEKNTDELTEYLSMLADDENLMSSFATKGKKNVTENHNLIIQTEKLEQIYEGVSS